MLPTSTVQAGSRLRWDRNAVRRVLEAQVLRIVWGRWLNMLFQMGCLDLFPIIRARSILVCLRGTDSEPGSVGSPDGLTEITRMSHWTLRRTFTQTQLKPASPMINIERCIHVAEEVRQALLDMSRVEAL